MSSGRVTDQKPASLGNSVMRGVQCTGHSERRRLNSACGGPSSQSSRSPTRTVSRSTWLMSLRVEVIVPSILVPDPGREFLTRFAPGAFHPRARVLRMAVAVRVAGRDLGFELSLHQGSRQALARALGRLHADRAW